MAIFLRFFISYIKIQKISYKYYQYSIFYVTYSKYKTIAGVKSCKHWKKCSFFIQVSAKLGIKTVSAAAYLNGLAGMEAEKRKGAIGMTAKDTIESLPEVLHQLLGW